VFNLIQQLKRVGQIPLFKIDKRVRDPLLNNDEILDLLHRVQSARKTLKYKRDIAFRQRGDIQSIYRGHGMDYEESRRYQPGDDPRYMNWQLSARTGQHYMKVFREERQPGVFILIDRRHSMRFGTQQRLKITQAIRAAAIAAFLAQENNFSIGGVILDRELEWFKENQNKQAVFDFIHQAARPALPSFHDRQAQQYKEPNIDDVLRMLNQVLTTGSTIYLISDFHDLNKDSESTLLQLSTSHNMHAIQIIDPAELNLPKAGNLSLKSISSDKQELINTNSSLEQKEYAAAAENYFDLKKSLFENIAVAYQQILTTDRNIEHKITF
jgi:uncharacterized protein (DUF58 family)